MRSARSQRPAACCVSQCSRSLALVPNQPEAYNNLGNAYKELGQIDQAEAAYRRAVEERQAQLDAALVEKENGCRLS